MSRADIIADLCGEEVACEYHNLLMDEAEYISKMQGEARPLTVEEIARVMGLHEGTVHRIQATALAKLRKKLSGDRGEAIRLLYADEPENTDVTEHFLHILTEALTEETA